MLPFAMWWPWGDNSKISVRLSIANSDRPKELYPLVACPVRHRMRAKVDPGRKRRPGGGGDAALLRASETSLRWNGAISYAPRSC